MEMSNLLEAVQQRLMQTPQAMRLRRERSSIRSAR